MDTKKATAEYRLQQWAQIIHERANSGLSVRAYCERIGIHENTYYYRQNKLRETACKELARETGGSQLAPHGGGESQAKSLMPIGQKAVVWAGINTKSISDSDSFGSSIKISREGWTVTVEPGTDCNQLSEVLKAVSRSCC